MHVGFIGLGRMGTPMARRLLAAGHRVSVHDIRSEAVAALVTDGAFACDGSAVVAGGADVIVTSLPGPDPVDAVFDELVTTLRDNSIVVETSTIGPDQSRRLAAMCSARGAHYLDSPVSGGEDGAQAGTLTAMVGGDPGALERARLVIACFASRIDHFGPVGSGNTMKLVIQAIFMSQMAAFLEGLALGERAGLKLNTLLDVLASSSAHHPTIAKRESKLLTDDLRPRFEVMAAAKDLSLAAQLANQLGLDANVVDAALAQFRTTADAGYAMSDLIALRKRLLGG